MVLNLELHCLLLNFKNFYTMERLIKIMLVEDDKNLGVILKSYLTAKGYPTTLCFSGEEALKQFDRECIDFMIVDVMMPGIDGFTLVEKLKKRNVDIPVMFLTGKSARSDISNGFKIGCDDYVIKPFSMEELLDRVKAISKRTILRQKEQRIFKISSYTFDIARHVLIRNGVEKKLTTRELDLLFMFCEYKNRVVERSYALHRIWHKDNFFNARNMDVYISKIRKLLKDDPNVVLENIHGVGYRLTVKK